MKIDLHVHSKFSTRPSQWVLQKIGCPESSTDPIRLRNIVLNRGMSMVTITDHNTIEGALEIAHLPEYPEQRLFYPPFLEMLRFCYEKDFTHLHSATLDRLAWLPWQFRTFSSCLSWEPTTLPCPSTRAISPMTVPLRN